MNQHVWESAPRLRRQARLSRGPHRGSYLLAVTDDEMRLMLTAELDTTELSELRTWIGQELRTRIADARSPRGT